MNKKNQGFTLIELLIAIAVLSTMAGALFQVFAVSGKIGLKAGESEVVQDIAKKTMEELKGYSFEKLDGLTAGSDGNTTGNVTIAGTAYSYEPLPSGETGDGDTPTTGEGYLLKRGYGSSGKEPGKAKYLIYAEADSGRYSDASEEAKDQAYSINKYQMPNIADVSSSQNVVLEPQVILKDKGDTITGDALRVAELLEKVNGASGDSGGDGGGDSNGDNNGGGENEPVYSEADIEKFIHLELKEGSGKLSAEASAIYTVNPAEKPGSFDPDLSITFSLATFQKKIVKDEKTGRPGNRIYVFLPEKANGEFEKLFVTVRAESVFELYVVAPEAYQNTNAEDFIFTDFVGQADDTIELYTNLKGGNKLVSLNREEKRLYHLTITVYEADYSGGTSEPEPGKELLKLESSKSENSKR